MNQRIKQFLSLLLVTAMLFGMMVFPVGAAETVTEKVTEAPTGEATEAPTEVPMEMPTEEPTEEATEAPTEEPTEAPEVDESFITGDCTITAGGIYQVAEGASGTIVVATAEPVTIVGNGAQWDESCNMTSVVNADLYIDCTTQAGVNLTLRDVYIHNSASATGVNGEGFGVVGFTGTDNTLNFEGVNVVEYQVGGGSAAGIHVKQGDALTIGGSGTLYFYKSAQGAGIGGSSGEVNGELTFAIGSLFAKGTKQGALIGAGSNSVNVEGAPGAISFVSGSYNLVSNSRGAAIGGSAGANGGSAGTTVTVEAQANININVDYSGAAVGGGGYAQGNDASGGTLVVTGGSLRTYIDSNAANNTTTGWNGKPFTAGVNDAAITAQRVNGAGEAVYLLTFDTTQLAAAADFFEVCVDGGGEPFYQGTLPEYGYVQEGLDKAEQLAVTSTPSNWYANGETNLYFYLTGEDHTLTVNGEAFTYYWDPLTQTFDTVKKANVTFFVDAADAGIIVSDGIGYTYLENTHEGFHFEATETEPEKTMYSLEPGEYTFTITCDGYYGAQGSFKVTDDAHAVSVATDSNINSYLKDDIFTIPMTPFVKSANEGAWDGVTIDVSWYDERATVHHIATPAQLAGLAAIVNGIYNVETTTILDDADGDGAAEAYTPYDYAHLANRKIIAANSTGSTGTNNQVTTLSYWYGAKSQGTFTTDEGEFPLPADFNGQTVYIDCDLDMGGHQVDGVWTGARYMTIGGQSLMHYIDYTAWMSDGYSHIGSSFNGTLDGQGHIIRNLYCDRYAAGSNYGDSVSVGLVGRLGVHDGDPETIKADAPTVRQIAVTGYVYGRRSVGGIVGKTGKSNGGTVIENCVNFAQVNNTDAKGVGGICGAAWNSGEIRNCANFGAIYAGRQNAGGISGSCEQPVTNCYNVGYVDAIDYKQGQSIGTDNGGAVYTNVYWLTGSSIADSVDTYAYPAVFRHDSKDTLTEVESFDGFKTAQFLESLNGDYRDWAFSNETDAISAVLAAVSFRNCKLDVEGVTAAGFPVPRCFITDEATVTAIEKTSDPEKLEYVEGQTFDPAGLEIVAAWSDGTTEILSDYTVSPDRPLTMDDTRVTVSGTKGGVAYSYDFAITVVANELNTLEITTKPSSTLYARDETFDPAGMVVKATYTVAPTTKVTLDAGAYSYTVEGELVTVSYTFAEKTLTATVALTILDTPAPCMNEAGSYELYTSNDVLWFANRIKAYKLVDLNAVVMNDITVADSFPGIGTFSAKYAGTFDAQGYTLTLNMDVTGSAGLFAYVDGAVIRNVTVAGRIATTSGTAGAAGIAAYVYDDGVVIENCVNKASVSGAGYVGGIVGKTYGSALTISGCVNEGEITSTGAYVGGIAGYLVGTGDAEAIAIVTDCTNNSSITATGAYAGGIAGFIKSAVTITRSGNEGAVSGKYEVGGILGSSADANDLVSSCYNAGSVTAASVGANHGVGGIVGCGLGNMENVYNLGSVISESTSTSATFGAGGIIGTIGNHSVPTNGIINAYNAGTVTTAGAVQVGALAGYIRYTSVMTNCHYLEGSAAAAYGALYDGAAVEGEAAVQTEESLKDLAETLGDAFWTDPEDYPALVWQDVDGACGSNLEWVLSNGTLTISGEGAMKAFGNKTAMPWYDYMAQITAVVIEDGVTTISDYAFYGMPVLESIWIADTVTSIGDYAFKNSTALDGVILPAGLTKLGDSAFYGCTSLTSIDIPSSLWTVKPYTFKNCTSLESVTFHEGNLQKISDGAFYNTALTSVELPDCLTILDVYVFKNCANLASVTLGSGITQIREASLYGTAISEITIPEGVTVIKPYAFKNCVNLVSVELPSTLTSVDEAAFYACTALECVVLPDAVTTIGNYAFRKCTGLTSVEFGTDLTNIGEASFYGCTGLTELVIPENVTTIQSYAFKGCIGVTSVTLPNSLVTIGDSAFHTCTGLKNIVIPASVETIGEYCFSGSYNLWQLTFRGDAPAIGAGAFKGMAATACYPGDNATWTAEIMQNYGGNITWTAV